MSELSVQIWHGFLYLCSNTNRGFSAVVCFLKWRLTPHNQHSNLWLVTWNENYWRSVSFRSKSYCQNMPQEKENTPFLESDCIFIFYFFNCFHYFCGVSNQLENSEFIRWQQKWKTGFAVLLHDVTLHPSTKSRSFFVHGKYSHGLTVKLSMFIQVKPPQQSPYSALSFVAQNRHFRISRWGPVSSCNSQSHPERKSNQPELGEMTPVR